MEVGMREILAQLKEHAQKGLHILTIKKCFESLSRNSKAGGFSGCFGAFRHL